MARSRLKEAWVLSQLRAGPVASTPDKPVKPPVAVPRTAGGSHDVRIIGGQWKRRRLAVAAVTGLRPTSDRVRETLFNWIAHQAGGDLSGWRCMDVFAGTGALGLEAASRGAAKVILAESSADAVRHLRGAVQLLQATQVQVVAGDGVSLLRQQAPGSLNLVFLDPPYTSTIYQAALQASHQALQPNGLVYLEAANAWSAEDLAALGFVCLRHFKAGQVHAHLLQPSAGA